ncbi:MAG: aspartate carbamoyltransferase catalytic subunit [Armatimonadota bacterium]
MTDLLDLKGVSAEDIKTLLDSADSFKDILYRDIKKVPTLRGRSLCTLFYENSTRTRVSFETAAKVMSADTASVSASGSSIQKGESLADTIWTLRAMQFDALVMRHPQSGAAAYAAAKLDIPVINAGDGMHAHPTQALLDMLTIRQHTGQLEGLTVAIVGDISHSRVARSNVWGMSAMGMNVRLVAPRTLLPRDVERFPAQVSTSLRDGIAGADVVMCLRLQSERMSGGLLPSLSEYAQQWGINSDTIKYAQHGALLMHPGPMNRGVEISAEMADSPQSVVLEQVTNGVAIRMSVLYHLLGGGSEA